MTSRFTRRVSALWVIAIIGAISTAFGAQVAPKRKELPRQTGDARDRSNGGKMRLPLSPVQERVIYLIDQLSEKAKDIDDDGIRIRLRAQIADALWDYDQARARGLFENAFRDSHAALANVQPKDPSFSSRFESAQFQLRNNILEMIVRRDPILAETLLNSAADIVVFGESERAILSQRLALTIADTNPERSAQLIMNSLKAGQSSVLGLSLAELGRKVPSVADDIFVQALSFARRSTQNQLGSIKSLAPYVFPDYLGEDRLSGRGHDRQPGESLIVQFLDFAFDAITTHAARLPVQPTANDPFSQSKSMFDYETVRRVLPYFDRYMPDRSSAIRAELSRMRGGTPRARPEAASRDEESLTVPDILKRAENAQTPSEKDRLQLQAAMLTSRRGDVDAALKIAESISDVPEKRDVVSLILYQAALRAMAGDDIETAYRYAKDISMPAQCAMVFGKLVGMLDKKDHLRALQVLDEAERTIHRLEDDPYKAHAMLMVAEVAAALNINRGFEIMGTAVRAINNAGFGSNQVARTGGSIRRVPMSFPMLSFDGTFKILAQSDFDRTLSLAQSIERREISILAQLAICRAVLLNVSPPTHRDDRKS